MTPYRRIIVADISEELFASILRVQEVQEDSLALL
jgi:hypothetical protein